MATNKNAFLRYKVLDNCFRNPGKKYFINDLIAACDNVMLEQDPESGGISRRQVFDDIAFMCSEPGWSIPLEKRRDGRKVYYRYHDLTFSINNMPLNEMEISQLQSAIGTLSQFSGMPQFEWVNELIPKLKQGLPSMASLPIIYFDSNPYLKGIGHLASLYNAIIYQKALRVEYQPYEHESSFELTIHPYHLKQYNNRWFLYGYNPYNQKYDWSLALDRIITFKETNDSYVQNDKIDWTDYFEDMIGVSRPVDAEVEPVLIHFFGNTGKYMESKPIHGSQKSRWIDDNILEVRLELIVNYELERLLLSYADTARIVEPKHLSARLNEKLTNAIKLNN